MSTFCVSLFLPYTINFKLDRSPGGRRTSSNASPPLRATRPDAQRPNTLLGTQTPPDSPEDGDGSAALFTQLGPSSPAIHFPKPHDPRSIARTDAHVPEWGRGRIFNQPRSRANHMPAPTILAYAKAQQDHAQGRLAQIDGQGSPSRDNAYSQSDWTVEPAIQGNGGLTNAIRASVDVDELEQILWVGTLGFPTDALATQQKHDIQDSLESEYDALTVFVNDNDLDCHYNRYCKTILWDSLNYQVPDHPKSKAYEDHSWVYYVKVNQAFADRVVQNYKHGDTIWVHDYHLMLVPGMIRKKLPDARIGFFLHTSFPSSEVFRCLAMRKDLLEGLLGANLVAFQAPEYAHHFLQTCSRILVVEAGEGAVQLEDRVVEVTAVPIGICPEQMTVARREPEVEEWIQTIKDKYKGKYLIVGRDKLDSIRGIKQKLLAYEMFLNQAPEELKEKVVMIQVATSIMKENKELDALISDIVTRINSRHSTLAHQPLVFLKQDIAFPQYLALLTVADVLMVTPLRDGMNLTCHEYLLCQDGYGGTKKYGPLILSEFTGSASLFTERGGELAVNPWDYQQMASAIQRALEMSPKEKHQRYDHLMKIVLENDGVNWVKRLRDHLNLAFERHQYRDTMSIPRLSISQLSAQYKRTKDRLFILDYEGTLAAKRMPQSPQRVVDTLTDLLAASDSNIVYVSSLRTTTELEQIFRQVSGLGLIAENGCFVRPFDSLDWVELADVTRATTAKENIMAILDYYRERTEGSWIEEKACGFVFHYAQAGDPEAAERQAGECANHIGDACNNLRMKVVPGDKCIMVEPKDISKVTASKWVLRSVRSAFENSVASGEICPSSRDFKLEMPVHRKSSIASTHPSNMASVDEVAESDTQAVAASVSSLTGGYFDSAMSLNKNLTPPHGSPEFSAKQVDPRESFDSASSRTGPARATGAAAEEFRGVPSRLSLSEDPRPSIAKQGAGPEDTLSLSRTSSKAIAPPSTVPDFLFVAGDDREDEAVFRWANELAKAGDINSVISVCVGKRNTEANCTLTQGATGLLTTLQKLAKA